MHVNAKISYTILSAGTAHYVREREGINQHLHFPELHDKQFGELDAWPQEGAVDASQAVGG